MNPVEATKERLYGHESCRNDKLSKEACFEAMKVIRSATELFHHSDKDNEDKSKNVTASNVMNNLDHSISLSSLQSTRSTIESSLEGWEIPQRSDQLSKEAGFAVLEQMEHFDSFSSLPDSDLTPVELSWEDLSVGDLLGSGGFSSVFQVSILPEQRETDSGRTNHNSSSEHRTSLQKGSYALKFLDEKLWQQADRFCDAAADLGLEAKLLSHLNHDNIIKLHGVSGGCPSTSFQRKGGFFLVLDFLEDTLDNRLAQWRATKQMSLLYRLESTVIGIALAMEHLHENNIVWRDLKPRNIGYKTGQVKLFDFGLAKEIDLGERLCSSAGTPRFMAPEVAMSKMYGLSGDAYSFGIVLWQLCSLKGPLIENTSPWKLSMSTLQ